MMTRAMRLVVGLVVAGGMLSVAAPAFAQYQVKTHGLTVDCNHVVVVDGTPTVDHECTLADFFQQFVILVQFAYGVLSVLAVLMFVYGGFQFLTAGGRQEKVREGQRVI